MDQPADVGIRDYGTTDTTPIAPPRAGLFNGRLSAWIGRVIELGIVDIDIGHIFIKRCIIIGIQRHLTIVARQFVDARLIARIHVGALRTQRRRRSRDEDSIIVRISAATQILLIARQSIISMLGSHNRLRSLVLYMRGSVSFDVQSKSSH